MVALIVRLLWRRPARLVSLSFVSVALAGAVLLSLPAATAAGVPLPFGDALFTAVSAVCVTGLIVVDTATVFSPFGQGVILLLIQIGGLGIMVFTMATVFLVRKRFSLGEAELLSFMLSENNYSALGVQLRRVLSVTVGFELAGAVVLAAAMYSHADGVLQAAWYGLFHAVSAFCNAGFALFSDSLERFVNAPAVNLTVMVLIVAGGIGFGTIAVLRGEAHRTFRFGRLRPPRSLSARVAIYGTGILIVSGAILIYLIEGRRSLADMTLPEKYLAAIFQSVTLRTAGFNTVPFGALNRATLLVMIPFMFIGAASGGTAGGVKIGTAAALFADFRRFFTRRRDARIFNRRLAGRLITQAMVLVVSGVSVALAATIVLAITEEAALEVVMFEVVSALGTVGLSAGLTPRLSDAGRVVVMLLMFVGRLGPLTLLAAFRPERGGVDIRVPEGVLTIG
ncbi:MAG: TrkH family potassium uptake protein [Spirochaetales bacterium]|nr:TrkH family potassium uptake protein [Spirochaetales bacterium]